MLSGDGITVHGGGISVGCCVSGTGADICTFESFGQGEQGMEGTGVEVCGDDFAGTFGDDAELRCENEGISGREMGYFEGKRGVCVRGGYMFLKTCASCLRAAS